MQNEAYLLFPRTRFSTEQHAFPGTLCLQCSAYIWTSKWVDLHGAHNRLMG